VREHWSERKAQKNLEKHGVSFEEAWTVFNDPLVRTYPDPDHSIDEDRFLAVGRSAGELLLIVGYTVISDEPWLINARVLTPAERRRMMRGDEIRDAAMRPDTDDEDDLRPFYEFDKMTFEVGKHYFPFLGIRVTLDRDVAEYFPTEDMVNDALRVLIAEGRATKQPPPQHPRLS
jgi:uncharacterized DUF497 family protein